MFPLYVSHYTLSTCLGKGRAAHWQAIQKQRSGLQACSFETISLPTYIGQVEGVEAITLAGQLNVFHCRNNQLAQLALQQDRFTEAVESAVRSYGKNRVGVFLGTSTAGILSTELAYRHRDAATGALPADFHYAQTHNTYSVSDFVRTYFDLAGPAIVVSSACSSSAKVFGNAARMISCGLIDAAIVGGVDSLCLTTLYGFNSLELLSAKPCRPFDQDRSGISISEAAGFALLTRDKPGKEKIIAVLGVGESSDAHHMSSPHPEGAGALAAMQQALQMAGVQARDVGYINLHGTATRSNDAAEGAAVAALFNTSVPCSSTKGHTGHALGAAGIVEAALCMLAMEHNMVPGGVHTQTVDSSIPIQYCLNNTEKKLTTVLSNSFGFGGSNCSLLLAKQ
jgi:3-oxoacyl-[acyl-carrier-protein] synthase I